MSTHIKVLALNNLAADPGSPVDGDIWYNATSDEYKGRANGVTVVLATSSQLAAFLEIDGTNAMTANLDFGTNKGVNLVAPTTAGDAAEFQWVIDQINSKIQGLDWQESVLDKDLSKPPGGPATGDRYIVAGETHAITAVNTGTEEFQIAGDQTTKLSVGEKFTVYGSTGNNAVYTVNTIGFTTQTNIIVDEDITDATVDGTIIFAEDAWNDWVDRIVEWDGAAWDSAIPNEGFTTRVMDENTFYIHDGGAAEPTSWGAFGASINHGNLFGLANDDHTQYLLVAGTRAMTGNLDMGSQNIVTVGTVDGVTVSNHSARHDPGGADALTTAAAVAVGAANAEGSATSLARSDHTHEVTNLKLASEAQGDIVYRNATVWARLGFGTSGQVLTTNGTGANPSWETNAAGGLETKAGVKAVGAFAGNPKTVVVTFATEFTTANYSVALAQETQNNAAYILAYHTKTTAGFTIEVQSDDISDLLNVSWTAIIHNDP